MVALALWCVPLGAATMIYLQGRVRSYAIHVSKQQGEDSPERRITGVKPVDNVLKVLVPFFRHSVATPTGVQVFAWVMSLGAAFQVFASVEGLRAGAMALHKFFPLHALLEQFLGISVSVPLTWTPLYLRHAKTTAIAPPAALLVGVGNALIALNAAAIVTTAAKRARQRLAILAFQLVPALTWLAWSGQAEPAVSISSAVDGPDAVRALYFCASGAFFVQHASLVLYFVANGRKGARDFFAAFDSRPSAQRDDFAVHFLAVDGAVLLVSMLNIVAAQPAGGMRAVLRILGRSPLVGPAAAFSLHCAERESKLAAL